MKKKIWILNVEDVPGLDEEGVIHTMQRYLLYLRPGDYCVLPETVNRLFLSYVSSIKRLGSPANWVIPIFTNNEGQRLTSLVLQNSSVLQYIHNLSSQYEIAPYIFTKDVLRIAEITGKNCDFNVIAENKDAVNTLGRFNDKISFKKICNEEGIQVVPGDAAYTLEEVVRGIKAVCKGGQAQAIIKKSMGSGLVIYGSQQELMNRLADWYQEEPVIVEQYKKVKATLGTLVTIDHQEIRFLGIDKQVIEGNIWQGCQFPYDAPQQEVLKQGSMRLAKALFKLGIRGQINLDWILVEEKGKEVLYVLECNFRRNGFDFLISVARDVIGDQMDEYHLLYYQGFKVNHPLDDLQYLQRFISRKSRIELQARDRYLVLAGTPQKGSCALILADRNERRLHDLRIDIASELSHGKYVSDRAAVS